MCYKNDRLAILLYEYMRRMDVKLDNEVIQLYNNIQLQDTITGVVNFVCSLMEG